MHEPYHCWTNLTYLQKIYIHLLAKLYLKKIRVLSYSLGVGILIFFLVHPNSYYFDMDALAALAVGTLAGYYTAYLTSALA